MSLIEIRHLRKEYPEVTPLEDVTVDIDSGEVVGIIGPSGTGKSTLLRCINRLEEPTSGQILVDGKDICAPSADLSEVRRDMGMVFQSFNLFPHLMVAENIMQPQQKLLGRSAAEAYEEALIQLRRVGLEGKERNYPSELSGGQKQRVAIARAPEREHFIYNSWHCSAYERKLCDEGLCNYIPMIFRNVVEYYRHFLDVNVAMMSVAPMDKHGYFNLSTSIGIAKGILEKADIVILEVNEQLPVIFGGYDDCIHISEVDMVVEGEHGPLVQMPIAPPKETDIKIAEAVIPYITNGATLQLGIGGMPGVIGEMIADSDLKDLGMHTELASNAYYDIFRSGKLTNRNSLIKGKGDTQRSDHRPDLRRHCDDSCNDRSQHGGYADLHGRAGQRSMAAHAFHRGIQRHKGRNQRTCNILSIQEDIRIPAQTVGI